MLRPKLLDNDGARCGGVSEISGAPGHRAEAIHQRLGKSVRVRRKFLPSDEPRQLPVAGCAILASGETPHAAERGARLCRRRDAAHRGDVSQPECSKIGQTEAADSVSNVSESIASFIPIQCCVGKLSYADTVENYQYTLFRD